MHRAFPQRCGFHGDGGAAAVGKLGGKAWPVGVTGLGGGRYVRTVCVCVCVRVRVHVRVVLRVMVVVVVVVMTVVVVVTAGVDMVVLVLVQAVIVEVVEVDVMERVVVDVVVGAVGGVGLGKVLMREREVRREVVGVVVRVRRVGRGGGGGGGGGAKVRVVVTESDVPNERRRRRRAARRVAHRGSRREMPTGWPRQRRSSAWHETASGGVSRRTKRGCGAETPCHQILPDATRRFRSYS
jgi:hypothetical protein